MLRHDEDSGNKWFISNSCYQVITADGNIACTAAGTASSPCNRGMESERLWVRNGRDRGTWRAKGGEE